MKIKSIAWKQSCRASVLLAVLLLTGSCLEEEKPMDAERQRMVAVLKQYGIRDGRVIEAMAKVRRHVYIPAELRDRADAYGDHPCPIGYGQTISQPFIVAYMTQRMDVTPDLQILEIGTGSGYQAAVLAELGAKVYSIEIIPELAEHARAVLPPRGIHPCRLKRAMGTRGGLSMHRSMRLS